MSEEGKVMGTYPVPYKPWFPHHCFKGRGLKSVERTTLDFGSGHDLTVHGIEPQIGLSTDSAEAARDSLSLSLLLPHSFAPVRTLSLSQ